VDATRGDGVAWWVSSRSRSEPTRTVAVRPRSCSRRSHS
jgi:hypothetical protein